MLPALVLAAGLGTRLRPLTYCRAKPAVPVAGQPLICRILRWLAASGVQDAVVNLHYLPDTVRAAVGDPSPLGLRSLRYSPERPILGTAGGARRALPLLASPRFLIVNGDTLTNVDLQALLDAHARSGALVTLALVPNPRPAQYASVLVSPAGEVTGFVGAGAAVTGWHFVGVQVAEAEIFAPLDPDQPASTVADLYPRLLATRPGSIRAFISEAVFHDIGTPADYLTTSHLIAHAEQQALPLAGARCRIHPTATIARTILWDDVEVGAGARLAGCIVGDRARIVPGACFEGCAIVAASGRKPGPGERVVGDLLVAPYAAPREITNGDAETC